MFSKSQKFGMAFLALLVIISFTVANSQPGDCNGDGMCNASDMVWLTQYLFTGGAGPVSFTDCDCDGLQGVDYGDLIQIVNSLFGPGLLFAYPGSDYVQTSQVKLFFNERVDFGANPVINQIQIEINVPAGINITNFMLPFSFLAEAGQTDISVTNIDFTGSVANAAMLTSSIYNGEEKFLIYDNLGMGTAAIPAGANGLLCTVTFAQDGPLAGPNDLRLCSRQHLWTMLMARPDYNGTDGIRVFIPEFIRAKYGDVNTDQTVNVSDAVLIINYIFAGGPPPGYKEP